VGGSFWEEREMQILITIAIAAPILIIACFLKAKKHTKIDTYLKAHMMDANEDQSWNL
jgi:hypothetical protein